MDLWQDWLVWGRAKSPQICHQLCQSSNNQHFEKKNFRQPYFLQGVHINLEGNYIFISLHSPFFVNTAYTFQCLENEDKVSSSGAF